jgi:hypothetical protein
VPTDDVRLALNTAESHALSAESWLNASQLPDVSPDDGAASLVRARLHMQFAQFYAMIANVENQRDAVAAAQRAADVVEKTTADTLISALMRDGWTPPDAKSNPRLHVNSLIDHLELAWGIIANSGVFGNPPEPTQGCREAAERWRDEWHMILRAWCSETLKRQSHITSTGEAQVADSADSADDQEACETCGGTGQVHEEGIIGAPGSGGNISCPDCTKTRPRL